MTPLSSFGSPVLQSFIHTDYVTDLYCTLLPALKVCLLRTDDVFLHTDPLYPTAYPPQYCN